MRPMIIGQPERERIAAVKAYALAHIVQLKDVVRMMSRPDLALGNTKEFRVEIPFGYRVVFSYEMQPPPGNLCAHLSMSVDLPEKPDHIVLPHTIAVREVMKEFGMQPIEKAAGVWVESIDDGGLGAVNVLTQVEEVEHE